MNSPWICFTLVAVGYFLGHATGYRLCKLRVKNMIRRHISNGKHNLPPDNPFAAGQNLITSAYSDMLSQVIQL